MLVLLHTSLRRSAITHGAAGQILDGSSFLFPACVWMLRNAQQSHSEKGPHACLQCLHCLRALLSVKTLHLCSPAQAIFTSTIAVTHILCPCSMLLLWIIHTLFKFTFMH